MLVRIKNKVLNFKKAKDGWYEAKGFVIDPNKTVCKTDPWYADYMCDAPAHKFNILNVS